MARFSSMGRIALGLVGLSVTVLLTAQTLGLIPDRNEAVIRGRRDLCEVIAVHSSLLASRGDITQWDEALRAIVHRNPDIVSAAVRRIDGRVLAEFGDHGRHWTSNAGGRTAWTSISVPITSPGGPWGTVEICFRPLSPAGFAGLWRSPLVRFLIFVAVIGYVANVVFLTKILRHLDPTRVIPDRVRAALDTLPEGLVVLDHDGRIVLANCSFAKTVGRSAESLQGVKISDMPWTSSTSSDESIDTSLLPWMRALKAGVAHTGVTIGLRTADADARTFLVNSSPLRGDDGSHRGVLASFDDITPLEQKKADLARMLEVLKKSSEEVRRQNQQLEIMATQDPLTGCMNRRAFFDRFDCLWSLAERHQHSLSCVMIDVDNFKSINDDHGHSMGDRVLKQVSQILKSSARESDLVCRFGGEEFCIVLPHTDLDAAENTAERLRAAITREKIEGLRITASFGASAMNLGAASPQVLLDQADKCLFVAKRNGRNQVVRWDRVPEDLVVDESQISRAAADDEQDTDVAVPYHAVTALISALAYRDLQTAEHSRRVADYCVMAADGHMSLSECYILEMAALLHDIGKVGVPDSILLKPGALTNEEWQVMLAHDRIGVEIVRASFASEHLSAIVENHHAQFGGTSQNDMLPTGKDIPLGARILTICDAYDAMVSDRVYRKGRTPEEACAELRRCAGSQFDPELVEGFIEKLKARDDQQQTSVSGISKAAALSIGVQIERLSDALDRRDLASLKIMANRLNSVAVRQGVQEIAQQAARLELAVNEDADLMAVLSSASDLLDLCRSSQRSYFQHQESR